MKKNYGYDNSFDSYLKEQLKNPKFKKEYDKTQPTYEVCKALIDARISRGLSQKELSKIIGIHQSEISKIESGERNPSLKILQKIANGLDMNLNITFTARS